MVAVPTRIDSFAGILAVSAGFDKQYALPEDGTVLEWNDSRSICATKACRVPASIRLRFIISHVLLAIAQKIDGIKEIASGCTGYFFESIDYGAVGSE